MEKKHSRKCIGNNSERLPASVVGMHKESKAISKSSSRSSKNSNDKPKIRIIHIFAPQIIKTDVENFRELVQRKTGKPPPTSAAAAENNMCEEEATTEQDAEYYYSSRRSNNSNSALNSGDDKPKSKKKKIMVDLRNKFGAASSSVVVKEEQVWCSSISDEISCGGYLGGFSDLEQDQGFISDLGAFSSMLPSFGLN